MQPAKLLAGAAIKIKLAITAIALLAIGAWLAPSRTTTLAPSAERPTPLLEEQVQQREASRPFRGVVDILDRITVRGVALEPHPRTAPMPANDYTPSRPPAPGAFGVPLGTGFVLTHRFALNGQRTTRVATDAGLAPAELVAYDEITGLVLLRSNPPVAAAASVAADIPASGTLAVGAAVENGRALVTPIFLTQVADHYLRIAGDGGVAAVGLPIYDTDGKLIAIAAGNGEARPVRAAIDRLLNRAMAESQPLSFGFAYQPNTAALHGAFGDGAAIVVDVLPDGPAQRDGIRPGDVITSIGGTAILSTDELQRVLGAATGAVVFGVRRAGRAQSIAVTPIASYDAAALADRDRQAPSSWPAGELLPAEEIEALAIPPRARVLMINGRLPATLAAARRELSRAAAPRTLLIDDDGRRFFAVIGGGS